MHPELELTEVLTLEYHFSDTSDKPYMGQSIQNGPSKICGRQPLKNLKGYGTPSNFLKAVFHKIYMVLS